MHQTLNVALGERSYPIHIGAGIISNAELYPKQLFERQLLIVSNTVVAPLYCSHLQAIFPHADLLILPDGESHKTMTTLQQILDHLMRENFARDSWIIALGGGVIGDMAGFAAAIYQRGISFVQIPTTLLSQVDSSVGGKTAVNHPLGKNMIGAFHQPSCVIADTTSLDSLPDREFSAGIAEIIKYGALGDPAFFEWLENNIADLMDKKPDTLNYAIAQSCRNKADIVAADEREAGQRALLNLGHTFGHAIETGSGYGNWLHGEAVAAGMCMAAEMSVAMGWLETSEQARLANLLNQAKLPTAPPTDMSTDQFLELMSHDKKVQAGTIRLVLLRNLGQSELTANYPPDLLRSVISDSLR